MPRKMERESARALLASKAWFRFQNSLPNFTMQKGDFPSHQNAGKCMKY
jgi:hypothetical protein